MEKLKKIILHILLYTIFGRNVDKLYSLRHYDSYYIKLGKEKKDGVDFYNFNLAVSCTSYSNKNLEITAVLIVIQIILLIIQIVYLFEDWKEEKPMIIGICIGLILGALLMNIATEEERRINERLKKTINNIEEDLDNANFKNELKDEKINNLQEELATLLENASELRKEKLNLENNLELVSNSLSEENKKLIPDFDSQN